MLKSSVISLISSSSQYPLLDVGLLYMNPCLLFSAVWVQFFLWHFVYSRHLRWSLSILLLVSHGRQFMVLLAHLIGCYFARCQGHRHISSTTLLSTSFSFVRLWISSFRTLFLWLPRIILSNALCAIWSLVTDLRVSAIVRYVRRSNIYDL